MKKFLLNTTFGIFLLSAILLGLVGNVECNKCYDLLPCPSSASSSSTVELKVGETHQSVSFKARTWASLVLNVSSFACNPDKDACQLLAVIGTDEELDAVKRNPTQNAIEALPFVQPGVNFYNISGPTYIQVHFLRERGSPYRLLLVLQGSPANASIIFHYELNYTSDVCTNWMLGFFLPFILIVVLFCLGLILSGNKRRDMRVTAETAWEGSEARKNEKTRRYQEEKRLRTAKSDAIWLCQPKLPVGSCTIEGMSKPKYPFYLHWVFSHQWLSLLKGAPDEGLRKVNRAVIALTRFTFGAIIITVWFFPILPSSQYVAVGSIKIHWREIGIDIVSKSFIVWLLEEVLCLFYPWLIYRAQVLGDKRTEIQIGGTSYDVSEDSPKWKAFARFLARELGAFILLILIAVFTLCWVLVAENLTCQYLAGIGIQLLVIEFYSSVFPGTVIAWLVYLFRNSCGHPAPTNSPFDENETYTSVAPAPIRMLDVDDL